MIKFRRCYWGKDLEIEWILKDAVVDTFYRLVMTIFKEPVNIFSIDDMQLIPSGHDMLKISNTVIVFQLTILRFLNNISQFSFMPNLIEKKMKLRKRLWFCIFSNLILEWAWVCIVQRRHQWPHFIEDNLSSLMKSSANDVLQFLTAYAQSFKVSYMKF